MKSSGRSWFVCWWGHYLCSPRDLLAICNNMPYNHLVGRTSRKEARGPRWCIPHALLAARPSFVSTILSCLLEPRGCGRRLVVGKRAWDRSGMTPKHLRAPSGISIESLLGTASRELGMKLSTSIGIHISCGWGRDTSRGLWEYLKIGSTL